MVRKTNAWVGVRPLDPEPFHDLRGEFSDILPSTYEPETDPHVTVLQCNLPEGRLHELEMKARKLALIGRTFTVDGVVCHPTPDAPTVIALDTEFDIEDERDELIKFIEARDGEPLAEPPSPHATLWMNDRDAEPMDEDAAARVAERIAELRDETTWEVQIGDVGVSTF